MTLKLIWIFVRDALLSPCKWLVNPRICTTVMRLSSCLAKGRSNAGRGGLAAARSQPREARLGVYKTPKFQRLSPPRNALLKLISKQYALIRKRPLPQSKLNQTHRPFRPHFSTTHTRFSRESACRNPPQLIKS